MDSQMASKVLPISANWEWRERSPESSVLQQDDGWTDCVTFPSDIHVELIHAKRIPDPYLGFNEHKIQWVGEREWLYRTTFGCDAPGPNVELLFEGLDTFCTVYLNGREILQTNNQFTSYTVPLEVSGLRPSGNLLLLHFLSAKKIALELEKEHGRVRAGSVNLGHPSRVYVRKAQYDWRWDWGPELMTAGPYRPISIKSYTAAIGNIYARASVDPMSLPLGLPPVFTLAVDLVLVGISSTVVGIGVTVSRHGSVNAIVETTIQPLSPFQPGVPITDIAKWVFRNNEVDLWWPVSHGKQPLYDVEVFLYGESGYVIDRRAQRVGFRMIELVQEPFTFKDVNHAVADRFHHGEGTSFFFRVNGVPMFIGGSNWIPADNLLTTITPERYRAWLQLLKDGNQNMVRLWGGGIYEPDCFYDICDELGILVWQDFQFACGVYPAYESFVKSVTIEAETNVTRLRHHPSIVIWCGNNEDYQLVLQWGEIHDLPARKLYEEVFPDVISRLTSPPTPYHRGSPYGGKGWDTSDPTVGDVHQWNIWAGAEKPFQYYDELGGRFVSEFGMPAMPNRRTIEYWLNDKVATEEQKQKMRFSQSKSMQQHNKAGSHERRFAIGMNENFKITSDFSTYIYLTQLLQSEAVSYAYRVWRREWRGPGCEYNAGAIVWQLNDCWPATSWAIADYFLRPKTVYYTIAREMAPYTVGMQRKVLMNRETDRPKQFYEFGAFQARGATLDVWGTNSTLEAKEVIVELKFFDLYSSWTHTYRLEKPVVLAPNSSTEIITSLDVFCPPHDTVGQLPDSDPLPTNSFSVVVSARFLDVAAPATIIARHSDWPQPYRMIDLPVKQDVQASVSPGHESKAAIVRVSAPSKPVKGAVLSVDSQYQDEDEVTWSDNALDLVPGDEQIIFAKGLKTAKLNIQYLGGNIEAISI